MNYGTVPPDYGGNTSERPHTRRHYARIRVVDTGVFPPSYVDQHSPIVPFTLILEPLYLNAVPASVVPVLIFLFPVVAIAWIVIAPRVYRYLSNVAKDIRIAHQKLE